MDATEEVIVNPSKQRNVHSKVLRGFVFYKYFDMCEVELEMKTYYNLQLSGKMPNPYFFVFCKDKSQYEAVNKDSNNILELLKTDKKIDVQKMVSSKGYMLAYSVLDDVRKGNLDSVYLRMIYIDPIYRKKGYGKILIGTFIKACKDFGAKNIQLESDNNSQIFFEKLGFIIMPNEPDNRMILNL